MNVCKLLNITSGDPLYFSSHGTVHFGKANRFFNFRFIVRNGLFEDLELDPCKETNEPFEAIIYWYRDETDERQALGHWSRMFCEEDVGLGVVFRVILGQWEGVDKAPAAPSLESLAARIQQTVGACFGIEAELPWWEGR